MGFEQAKTTHHFLLKPDGGAIQVQADDPQDTVSLGQTRKHFHRIAAAFAAGNFQIPMTVHDTLPPGANAMKRLHGKKSTIPMRKCGLEHASSLRRAKS